MLNYIKQIIEQNNEEESEEEKQESKDNNKNKDKSSNESKNSEEEDNNSLVQYTYESAADELVERGFLLKWVDKHQNPIYLIRHFFIHNKYNPKYISTNYFSLRAKVELIDGCWELKENHLRKENQENNANKENKSNDNNDWEEDWDKTMKELNESPSCSQEQKPFQELEDLPDNVNPNDPFDFSGKENKKNERANDDL